MNNFNTLFSLIRGRSNQRFFNMFGNKKTNNGSMILWSLLGLTTLGVIGSRNTRWVQKIREGYNNLRNNTRIPLKNQVYFLMNLLKI
ncbi:hypothetical protein [Metabacillus sediminilitoris]|uniref:Uncharacterized protein n=1 Tax=Metabacillus sediminilitoris TaxID=2567941 RepID=A0A4S4BK04_9BACI|nr:hypothetical protein [Metabacillus sediminilitoris]QGQ44845.1 hypothetical protein GMB29_05940 [Metabacillus sediminilitoris]THF74772.1 hypothetical protein E6W99_24790 [Metabacillus sediminilitoris]